jgi:glyoxylase-like metal-dependent hydrolase (beta-lactamase superfamily II)
MNKGIFSLIVCVFALLLIQTGVAGEEILIRAEKLTDCVLVLRAGNNPQNPNVTAVATDKGIVVIDSHMAPSIALEMRRRMEQEFGRDDFVYLINTHHHFDHSNGNQVFPEALVIGHKNAPAAFRRFAESIPDFVTMRRQRLERMQGQLKFLEPGSQEDAWFQERMAVEAAMVRALEGEFRSTPPTCTFSDRMNLKLGDTLFHLIYFGRAHTDNDILIHVVQEKVLLCGDTLESLLLRPGEEPEVERWLRRLDEIQRAREGIEHIITGHGRMTLEEIDTLRERVADLWGRVQGRTSALTALVETEERAGIEAALNAFKKIRAENSDSFYFEPDQFIDLTARWLQSGKGRAGAEVYRLAVDEFPQHLTRNAYLEEWFAGAGESLLRGGKVDEAIIMFQANAAAYPESVRSWSGLGEALLRQGKKEEARAALQQALKLNPDNGELIRRLKEIKEPPNITQ